MTNITFGGLDLGEVQSLRVETNCGLFAIPMPLQGVESRIIFDLGGNTRRVELMTEYIGTSGTITTFLSNLDTFAVPPQVGRTLALPFGQSMEVCIENWNYSIETGKGGAIDTGSTIIAISINFANGTIFPLI